MEKAAGADIGRETGPAGDLWAAIDARDGPPDGAGQGLHDLILGGGPLVS